MNNIFYIEGKTKLVLGDQYKPDTEGEFAMTNVVFKNNLFLNEACWNPDIPIDDESPLYDDPLFVNKGGLNIEDYLPTNTDLIKDSGIFS